MAASYFSQNKNFILVKNNDFQVGSDFRFEFQIFFVERACLDKILTQLVGVVRFLARNKNFRKKIKRGRVDDWKGKVKNLTRGVFKAVGVVPFGSSSGFRF